MRCTSLAPRAVVRAGLSLALVVPGCSSDPAEPIEIETLAQGGLCGDGLCLGDETDESCPGDCGCSSQPSLCAVQVVAPYGCWCDADCHDSGDCCADVDICGEVPPNIDDTTDEGACAWGDDEPNFIDELNIKFYQAKYYAVARASELAPDLADEARMYLIHFLENSGTEMDVDVDKMLRDVSSFAAQIDTYRVALAKKVAADAERANATGTISKQIPHEWKQDGEASILESVNWFLSLHAFQYNLTGTVTVTPAGDGWSYKVVSRVHVADYYDWDPTKPVPIYNPAELYQLNCWGHAQNFWIRGMSDESTLEGTIP
jgi:hypothetical protein